MKTRPPTSFDVAALAGVSQPTVSLAVRDSPRVSAETRARILRIAREIGYVPDRRAMRLRGARTRCIALVILLPDDLKPREVNPLYWDLIAAIETAAAARGYRILLSLQPNGSDRNCDFEAERDADGTIVLGSVSAEQGWARFAALNAEGRRIVAWGAPDMRIPSIRCDNRAAGALAAGHLIAGGCRRVAFIGPGHAHHVAYQDRRTGCAVRLAEAGLELIDVDQAATGPREAQGRAAIEGLLESGTRFDGVFAAGDLLAIGALSALRDRGLAVPEDVAVIGFDGIRSSAHARPSLSTVEQDTEAAGRMLVAALLRRIDDQPAEDADVPVNLRQRASSRSPG
ncbi:substrate-binding domain-containing protein [Sphingomonas sp.]|uniref:LacI family DNA-binding transcriptional regulator n=1 Tax=Sphingomonas sp. TaxID=28214 RepID=UPI001ED4B50A|nr:substrate-binding domain-containing protein [Sphingomonas sp.]MBX3595022.1 substrate-binding domain-containing protein [Sphingomonas sp.]